MVGMTGILRLCVALLALSLLAGCAARQAGWDSTEGLEARLRLLVNVPEGELSSRLVRVLEVPVAPDLTNADCLPGGNKNVEYQLVMGGRGAETATCLLWFAVSGGVVRSYRFEGAGCRGFAPLKTFSRAEESFAGMVPGVAGMCPKG